MVLGKNFQIFAVYLCENITIAYVWIWITPKSEGASPKFFQKLYETLLSIRPMKTRCSAIAKRPRCRMRYSFSRQTDRQTDRILIARPRLHSMQCGKKPRNIAPFLGSVPPENATFNKSCNFRGPIVQIVLRGWCPRYGAFLRGFSVLPNGRSKTAIFA